jgi:hypothetical protein
MPNDLAELTSLNRDYVNSVQHSDVRRFDEILAQDFYCTNPDAVDFATLFAMPPPALAVGRVGRSEAEDGVGGYRRPRLRRHPPPVTSFAALTRCHPPHRWSGGRD